jgi:putative transcriptional regulator
MTDRELAHLFLRVALSQEEFAARFHIPLGALRDWEQGRRDPDTAARAYFRVIGHNPAAVTEALRPPTPTPSRTNDSQ